MDDQVLSVSEFNALVDQTLEFAYPRVVIEGELAESRPTKHFYFTLKDAEASLRCIKWGQLRDPVENGMQVRITGRPKLHPQYGFSFIVDAIEPAGLGSIQRAFEILKAKLEAEGLFASERKRQLPPYPRVIGVVSSIDAAGYKDFLKIINDRWVGVTIHTANVLVQGSQAPAQIMRAIEHFNQSPQLPDVVAIIRGGGSLEDLQAFNTEEVARAIASSRIPTITGVGHEIDITLADLAADVRAATPTDAANKIVPSKIEMKSQLEFTQKHLLQLQQQNIAERHHQIRQYLQILDHFVSQPKDNLRAISVSLVSWLQRYSENILSMKTELATKRKALVRSVKLQIENSKWEVVSSKRTLNTLNPRSILSRGYSIVRSSEKIVRTKEDIKIGDSLVIQLAKDVLGAEVTDVR